VASSFEIHKIINPEEIKVNAVITSAADGAKWSAS
jgi:hypothetical protein